MNVAFDSETHTYTLNDSRYASVTQILEFNKLTPPYPAEDRGQQALGTAIHRAGELAVWDRLDCSGTSPELLPYIEGLMEKVHEMKIRPIETELRGVHLLEGYAGTTDLLCRIFDGDLAVIDYKSGKPPRCTELQTAGYGELVRFMESLKEKPLFTSANMPRRFSMQLTPGRAIVREHRDPFDYQAFIGAVRLFRWQKERRVIA